MTLIGVLAWIMVFRLGERICLRDGCLLDLRAWIKIWSRTSEKAQDFLSDLANGFVPRGFEELDLSVWSDRADESHDGYLSSR